MFEGRVVFGRQIRVRAVRLAFLTILSLGAILLGIFLSRANHSCGDLGKVSDFPPATVTRVECFPAYVVNDGNELSVLLAESNHLLGEGLEWSANDQAFLSSHEERFDINGDVIGVGPAQGPLWRCKAVTVEGRLLIEGSDGLEPQGLVQKCKADDG